MLRGWKDDGCRLQMLCIIVVDASAVALMYMLDEIRTRLKYKDIQLIVIGTSNFMLFDILCPPCAVTVFQATFDPLEQEKMGMSAFVSWNFSS